VTVPAVPDAEAASRRVVGPEPLSAVRHQVVGLSGELIVPNVAVVLVDRRRRDQVVPRGVGTVGKGARVEWNLAQFQVDVPPLRVRQPRERAEESRGVGVVGKEFHEPGDVLVNLRVGDQAEPARVERVLAEVEEVGSDLVVLRDPDQVQVSFEVDRGPLGPECESGRARSRARPEDEEQRGDEGAEPA